MMFENHCSKGLVTNVYCHVDLNWLFLKRPHYTADTRKEKKKKKTEKTPEKPFRVIVTGMTIFHVQFMNVTNPDQTDRLLSTSTLCSVLLLTSFVWIILTDGCVGHFKPISCY